MKVTITIICLLLFRATTLQAQDLIPFKHENNLYGYKDKTGKMIVEPKYDHADIFVEGMARVGIIEKPLKSDKKDTGTSGYSSANILASMRSTPIYAWGFINSKGEEVITPKYYKSANFSEGSAVVNLNGNWGYIDKTGKEIIPFKFDEAFPFKNGKAEVEKNGRKFSINKKGEEVN